MAGESSHPVVTAALLPIVAGVGLVSREASLTWGGFLFAVASSASVGELIFWVLLYYCSLAVGGDCDFVFCSAWIFGCDSANLARAQPT